MSTVLPDLLIPHIERAIAAATTSTRHAEISSPGAPLRSFAGISAPCPVCGTDAGVPCTFPQTAPATPSHRTMRAGAARHLEVLRMSGDTTLYVSELQAACALAVLTAMKSLEYRFRALFVPCPAPICGASALMPCSTDDGGMMGSHAGRFQATNDYQAALTKIVADSRGGWTDKQAKP